MNDRHPSGSASSPPTAHAAAEAPYGLYTGYGEQGAHSGYAGYDGTASQNSWGTGTFDHLGMAYGDADPLFGALPGSYDTGQYATTQWDTTGSPSVSYDAYGAQTYGAAGTYGGADTYGAAGTYSGYDTTAYGTGSYDVSTLWAANIPAQAGPAPVETLDGTGQWDAGAWTNTGVEYGTTHYTTGEYETAQWAEQPPAQTQTWDVSAQAAMQEFQGGAPEAMTDVAEEPYASVPEAEAESTALFEALDPTGFDAGPGTDPGSYPEEHPGFDTDDRVVFASAPGRPVARSVSRSRRRTPGRSALLTVAVPSVAVMGVAGIAAASVSGLGKDDKTEQAAPDTGVKPAAANSKLDTQLASLTADADDFADRASRTQERLDLKQRQLAEKKRKAEEAARREALRPKYALPVEEQGLSAYYGQAGVNWMSVHSGIDFPVSYGTPVMAATDGTVRTQYNLSYGNMAIVTAPDGTETWYCHLSSTKIRSGSVKAGDVIAYSGNSGNSTGPHLHFEVRPGGGSAIDPLAWLRNHGLDPT
ncbi:M23 family metallopeptidase [Streptomyces sp. KR80]|uniref:M23 family metallopeptidase n=1 Tax=Streptomyces sp. KR80 TaxID=3457426 RepID=UPI003FD324E7